MKYEMTNPCDNCPFRTDNPISLRRRRAQQIANSILSGSTFSCHKTNEFDDDDAIETANSQHCAGAMIFLEHQEKPNQMMRIMERLGAYDYRKLNMKAPVAKTLREFLRLHTS